MTYPLPSNPDFTKTINTIFSKYEISQKQKTFNEICFPKTYELQIPQMFLAEYMNPRTPYRGLLVYHKIGGGKSCVAINIAERFIGKKNIIIVLPASLKGNFRNELRTPCAGEKYLTNNEKETIKKLQPNDQNYIDIITKSDDRIDKHYTIYSYNKFIKLSRIGKINLANSLLIIDEIQNMVSETGIYYHVLYDMIKQYPTDMRLVLMTATPIFDKPIELALTMNLLINDEFPTGKDFDEQFIKKNKNEFNVINMDIFKKKIKGYVSYYRGAPDFVFPKTEIYFINCIMSDEQLVLYNMIAKKEDVSGELNSLDDKMSNKFYIGTRMTSNFMYPYQKDYDILNDADFEMKNLLLLSSKYHKIITKIKKCDGTIFIYSNFKQYGGLASLIRALKVNGHFDYASSGVGENTFAVWSGDEKMRYREEIKTIFNNKDNEDGSKIKIILGSSAIKEGVSLFRIQEVHIIEPYFNWSRLDQVIGRSSRYCSHKDVIPGKQLVRVYVYFAVHGSLKMSVDQIIMNIALNKKIINIKFERALKEAAIDCTLFRYGNIDKNDSPIRCDE